MSKHKARQAANPEGAIVVAVVFPTAVPTAYICANAMAAQGVNGWAQQSAKLAEDKTDSRVYEDVVQDTLSRYRGFEDLPQDEDFQHVALLQIPRVVKHESGTDASATCDLKVLIWKRALYNLPILFVIGACIPTTHGNVTLNRFHIERHRISGYALTAT